MKDRETLEKAIKLYGPLSQVIKLFEEMAELQKEICKNVFGKHNDINIAEEIADVQIMLDQMSIIYYYESIERLNQKLTIWRKDNE